MSRQRVIKQTAYAGGCLGTLFLVIVGLTALVLQPRLPAQPTPTPPPKYQPLQVDQVDVISHGATVDIVARLTNPNARTGFPDVPVTFIITGTDGTELANRREQAYVLPGSLQYVIALNVPLTGAVGNIRVDLPETLATTDLPAGLTLPTFSTFLQERTRQTIGTAVIEEQKGIVTNSSSFDFQRVEVAALAFDTNGTIVGAGKTFLGELQVGEQREFTIQWPAPTTPTERVLTLTNTNIFEEDNIIRVIGDPSQLR